MPEKAAGKRDTTRRASGGKDLFLVRNVSYLHSIMNVHLFSSTFTITRTLPRASKRTTTRIEGEVGFDYETLAYYESTS